MYVFSIIAVLATFVSVFHVSQSFSIVDHPIATPPHHYGFRYQRPSHASDRSKGSKATIMNLQIDADLIREMTNSRVTFWLCFFGAGGSAAVGRAAIPKTIDSIKLNQSLKGRPSLGGESLGLFGYPETIYRKDVEMILNNPMSIAEMMEKYPIEGRFNNLLQYESFVKANPDANPLAVRAVFESLVIGINKKSAIPFDAQKNIDLFKADLDALRNKNNISKAVGVTALIFLLGLIGGADWFAFYHGWKGWFPLWPGLSDFPRLLFAEDTGILAIPNFWMSDIPKL